MEEHLRFLSFKVRVVPFLILCLFSVFPNQVLSASLILRGSQPDSIYTQLVYRGLEQLPSTAWTKSVLFNSAGTRLYTFNLEEMSISEFDGSTKELIRTLVFKPTPAVGWDYQKKKPMASFEEKPVEGCFSHDDRLLWVSLHNAGGIVAIPMDSLAGTTETSAGYPTKTIFAFNVLSQSTDTLTVPFIRTGKTPKVIAVTPDGKSLLVSNWHSSTVSVIRINDTLPPYGEKIKDIRTGVLPRGIAISSGANVYVTNMGSEKISVINWHSWKTERSIPTGAGARHIVAAEGRLYVSNTATSRITCIDNRISQRFFRTATSASPRTIALSKDRKFLFVACYEANSIEVFKINEGNFSRIYSIKCSGKPVGIDLREVTGKLEAWVCTYTGKTLQVFCFDKS